MVAIARAHPGHTCVCGFFDRELNCMRHHQMPHPVITIDHSHRGLIVHDFNLRIHVDPTSPNTLDVLRQANHAMTVRALQIGLRHERRNFVSVLKRQPIGLQGARDKVFECVELNDD